jgi:hypothetical protein
MTDLERLEQLLEPVLEVRDQTERETHLVEPLQGRDRVGMEPV